MNDSRSFRRLLVLGIMAALLMTLALPARAMGNSMSASMAQSSCCSGGTTGHTFALHGYCCATCTPAGFAVPVMPATVPPAPTDAFVLAAVVIPVPQSVGPPPTPPPKR